MLKLSATIYFSLIAAVFLVNTTAAQDLSQRCLKNKEEICGDAPANQCFEKQSNWQAIHPECVGDIQTLIEMASEAMADQSYEGASLGGKVRSGPGMDHAQIGSLAEGDLMMLEPTEIVMDGYPWFKISHVDNMTGYSLSGYQWGGILCAFDDVKGVFSICPNLWSDNPNRTTSSQ
jgi:hypothetical protein